MYMGRPYLPDPRVVEFSYEWKAIRYRPFVPFQKENSTDLQQVWHHRQWKCSPVSQVNLHK